MYDRGVIRNRQYATQVIDYSGLRFGNITPTNIDGQLDFGGKLFITLEYKYRGATLPTGQRKHLEYVANNSVKPWYVIVAEHTSDGDIDAASATVVEAYYNYNRRRRWKSIGERITVFEAIARIRQQHNLDIASPVAS